MKKYKFFWGGNFSNWAYSEFVLDDIKFYCGEQYMMYKKAMLFNDKKIASQILDLKYNPKEQKKLGRKVKSFNNKIWDERKYNIVKTGLKEKFLQNEDLKKELLSFKGYDFVEASPYDNIWGIGFDEKHALYNIEHWGENLLGKIITELSNEL
jgi:ribA/ribD-fused uncharacterized protein